ncbi:hypothetical protein ASF49_08040 [Methylobacterium sp. Leaf104]|uniref:hypothetical protein n=1 Tax=Methylobacterium TaxID=407 RepID=UPI0006F78B71|nr:MULTISPECIES: hypothetical protein [Methylobacterium]KQP33807.1 hypothetical protein ASF49_08040 [Methylobacterium sp. Leaf104]MCI9879625.1 hypothetical protein [Methylobacterium goesingense]
MNTCEMNTAGPPEAFDLTWAIRKEIPDGRVLYVAEASTPEFEQAWKVIGMEIRHLGFSLTEGRPGDGWTGSRPTFWLAKAGWSVPAWARYQALLPAAIKRVAEYEEMQERIKASWAADRAAKAAFVPNARAAARASLDARPWAWTKAENAAEAEALLAREDLDTAGARRLNKLTRAADGNVERARATAATASTAELSRAGDARVREAAREAVALLTGKDLDRATTTNHEGWGRSTSILGHVLADMGELDEAQASHALRILKTHRRQLPAELAVRVFGS